MLQTVTKIEIRKGVADQDLERGIEITGRGVDLDLERDVAEVGINMIEKEAVLDRRKRVKVEEEGLHCIGMYHHLVLNI